MIVLAVIAAGISWVALKSYHAKNYAEEVASPLEESLVKAGGVRMCSTGDTGRGSDNDVPWYGVYYEMPENRSKAIDIINKVASDNGYSLSHASLTNRGDVPVADAYIDNWFYDTTGKPSSYKDLKPGKIKLFFAVNNDRPIELSAVSCGTSKTVKVNSGTNVSAINLQLSLPPFTK